MLQCVAVYYGVLPCVEVCCGVLRSDKFVIVLQCVVVCCRVLQDVAGCYRVLQGDT